MPMKDSTCPSADEVLRCQTYIKVMFPMNIRETSRCIFSLRVKVEPTEIRSHSRPSFTYLLPDPSAEAGKCCLEINQM